MPFEKKEGELGALWKRSSARGEFLSGTIEGVGDVVCYPVSSSNPKAPAYRVIKSKPRPDAADQRTPLDDF